LPATNNPRLAIVPVVGCAVATSILTVIVGGMLERVAAKPQAPFTLPFHIVVWVWLLAAQQFGQFPNNVEAIAPRLPLQVCLRFPSLIRHRVHACK